MKKIFIIIFFTLTSNLIFSQDIINVFYLGEDVCGPVLLTCSQGEYSVDNGTQISGNLYNLEAWDCNGNKILDTSPDETYIDSENSTVRKYVFEYLYSSSVNNDNDDYYAYDDNATQNLMEQGINGFVNITDEFRGVDAEGYPYLGVEMGISRFFGEFARINIAAGRMSGTHLFGGIGKDIIFKYVNSERLAWHVGIGTYISWGSYYCSENNQAIKLDIAIGETPIVINKALWGGLSYEYYFGKTKRFGVFGGLGLTWGNLKSTDPVYDWDFQVGLGVKLWSNK